MFHSISKSSTGVSDKTWKWTQPTRGVTSGGKGGTIPWAPICYGSTESLRGRRISAEAAEKSQQCHKYFLQYSKFAIERPQVPL